MLFENVKIKGVHATRYYASWVREGGDPGDYGSFSDWLKSLGFPDEELCLTLELARNGRMELETSVRNYLKTVKTAE